MKTKKTSKTAKTVTKKPTEFYVVSWADYDEDCNSMTNGVLTELYSTKRKAHAAVIMMAKEMAKEAWGNYDNPAREYGVESASALAKKIVVSDSGDFICMEHPDYAVRSQYVIAKFSTEFVK